MDCKLKSMGGSKGGVGCAPTSSGSSAAASSAAAAADLDRKVLRDTLYSEIIQRHRKSIFALGSFLRMLKSKKSNYNVIKTDGESD